VGLPLEPRLPESQPSTPCSAVAWVRHDGSVAGRQDLIRGLLTREPAARLGSAACGGAQRIFAHPFFEGLPWEGLLQGAPGPPVPHVHACLAGINSVLPAQGLHPAETLSTSACWSSTIKRIEIDEDIGKKSTVSHRLLWQGAGKEQKLGTMGAGMLPQ